METEVVLYMTFRNSNGNSVTITVDNPKKDLEEEKIIEAMNKIKQLNIFLPKGYEITECVSAKVVNAETSIFDLEI